MDIFDKHDAAPTVEARLQAVEAKLDAIIAHLGIGGAAAASPTPFPPTDPRAMPAVMDLIRRGKKIQAIKHYRELTGVGLKEAKEAVERVS
jgi:ribosomal protein L7/L12